MGGREHGGWGAATTAAPATARTPSADPARAWERWGWVAVRTVAGWYWLDQGSRALASATDGWALALATGQVLAGIAVMLGFLTGAAALLLVGAGVVAMAAGAPPAPIPLAAAIALVPAWRRAGAIGFDHWLLARRFRVRDGAAAANE